MQNWNILFNPNAASGKARRNLIRLQDEARKRHLHFPVFETRCAGDGIVRCREMLNQGIRHILVLGGDGTLHEVSQAILEMGISNVHLALFPSGTGNDTARSWQLSARVSRLLDGLQKDGPFQTSDAGSIAYPDGSVRYFLNVAGAGFDAFVANRANEKKNRGKSGALAYLQSLVESLWMYREPEMRIHMEHETIETSVFTVLAGIGAYAGNGMKLVPHAQINDGKLAVTLVHKINRGKIIRNLPRLFSGRFTHFKEVRCYSCNEFRIEGPASVFLQADGELSGNLPVQIRILPNALQYLAY